MDKYKYMETFNDFLSSDQFVRQQINASSIASFVGDVFYLEVLENQYRMFYDMPSGYTSQGILLQIPPLSQCEWMAGKTSVYDQAIATLKMNFYKALEDKNNATTTNF